MQKYSHIFTLLISALSLNVGMVKAELKDPITRDANISNTSVNVSVTREGNLYRYTYSINNPSTNLGTINNFLIDLSCDIDFGDVEIPVPSERLGYLGSKSSDTLHVPAEIFAGYGTSNAYGITKSNHALWGLYMVPDTTVEPISILSVAPPGARNYFLQPFLNNNPDVWDYTGYEEDDPNLPWIEDFTISGTITGPACKTDEPSGDLFKGTGAEPFNINGLLQYSDPVKDPLYVKSENELVKVSINYSDSIQKQSFKAKLNGVDISNLFKPVPGSKETITVSGPWKKLNKLKLSVLGVTDGRVKGASQDVRPTQSLSTPAVNNAKRKFDEFK